MFFARQNKRAKIFPVTDSDTESETESSSHSSNTEVTEILTLPFSKANNEDLSKTVLYSIMDQLLQKNAFCNEFGVIDLSNIDDFEIDLFELKGKDKDETYGFKVSPIGCMITNGSMCDGIVSNHCVHDVEHWLPLFHPTMDIEKEKLEWYVFVSSSFSL
jgi:hypothetical protein